jgi:hypothetical protein
MARAVSSTTCQAAGRLVTHATLGAQSEAWESVCRRGDVIGRLAGYPSRLGRETGTV